MTLKARYGRKFDIACTVRVEHTAEMLGAHVELDDNVPIGPGDRVRVHGGPVKVQFGETLVIRRDATVTRATPFDRAWVRLRSMFELTELYEVSFSPGRTL